MFNFSFGRQQQAEYEPQDLLVIVSDEDRTLRIAPVEHVDGEAIYAASAIDGRYSVPLADAQAYTGSRGRIYLTGYSLENIQDCQRLAMLERSIVLRQITHFAPEYAEATRSPLLKILLIGGAVLFFFILLMVAVSK